MITPRTTRLIRTGDLGAFRRAIVSLVSQGEPLDSRDRLVVVPTRAAAALLTRARERDRLDETSALLHPEFITARELPAAIGRRAAPQLTPSRLEAREVLMGVACRHAAADHPPPFLLRPGLVAQALAFYDALIRRRRDVATFERLTLGRLEPGAEYDRGAERLVRQTRFLAAAYRAFEWLSSERGFIDDRTLRDAAISTGANEPWRHVVVTVGDEARDRYGLCAADWDLLTRVPGLERLDVVVTERTLAGEWHQHIHQLLPDIAEVRFDDHAEQSSSIFLRAPRTSHPANPLVWNARDREEEVAGFARWTRLLHHEDPTVDLERIGLVVRQPLPYVYLAREVLRSANIQSQTFDALPLAAEPYAAALDLIFSAVSTNLSRTSCIALLASPHFSWRVDSEPVSPLSIAAADAVLSERGYMGGLSALKQVAGAATDVSTRRRRTAAAPALKALVALGEDLDSLRIEAPAADHLDTVIEFLISHERPIDDEEPVRSRSLRARGAVQGILAGLRDDFRELDAEPVGLDRIASTVRRWIEAHTFAPRVGDGGVQLVDAESAKFGEFDHVQLAGLVDREWPERPHRNIFYGSSVLRDLGWLAESEHMAQARSAFADLLDLPAKVLTVSSFILEDDSTVAPSSLLDELATWRHDIVESADYAASIFEAEILMAVPARFDELPPVALNAARWRQTRPSQGEPRFHGSTTAHTPKAFSLSSLERYQDCPFKYFAADVLRLSEEPEDEPFLSPRARGRFVHEVFQRFFEAWDAQAARTITVENMDAARDLFAEIAAPLLAALNESDAALEHARLFGSAIATGMVDVVLGLEASRPSVVQRRLLESGFDGEFSLAQDHGVRIPIRGIADRIDLLDGHRLRVIDYKTGHAPDVGRALQVPIYALCAQEQLRQGGESWEVAEASYVAFSGKRALVPVIAPGDDPAPILAAARERLLEAVAGVTSGGFQPRPHDRTLCRSCAYPTVCRKDYVDAQP